MTKTYLVFIVLGASEPITPTRIRESATAAKRIFEDLSGGDCKLAFASSDGASYAYFVRSDLDAHRIRGALDGAGKHVHALRNSDSCLVVELGKDYTGQGFSQAWTWLQHHHR